MHPIEKSGPAFTESPRARTGSNVDQTVKRPSADALMSADTLDHSSMSTAGSHASSGSVGSLLSSASSSSLRKLIGRLPTRRSKQPAHIGTTGSGKPGTVPLSYLRPLHTAESFAELLESHGAPRPR